MLKVKYPIVVEGKYDKAKLSSIVDSEIIVTNGFSIFKNKEKVNYLRKISVDGKLILLTDSDTAGFKIRNYLCGCLPTHSIIHIYVPEIIGKEKRKEKPSAQGLLGVEGVPTDILRSAFAQAGVLVDDDAEQPPQRVQITKQFLYELGLSGVANSAELRRKVLKHYDLPQALSANALCTALSRVATQEELAQTLERISQE